MSLTRIGYGVLAASQNLDEVLTLLADCSEGDAMTLMVAIPQQLRDGCYS